MTAKYDPICIELVKKGVLIVGENGSVWQAKAYRRGEWIALEEPRARRAVNSDGYLEARVYIGYKQVNLKAHRIVWYWFHGFLDEDREINHIDGVKGNNTITNLELVTSSENTIHAFTVLKVPTTLGEKHPCAKLNNEKAAEIFDMINGGKTRREVADLFKIHKTSVDNVMNGKTWSCATGIIRRVRVAGTR